MKKIIFITSLICASFKIFAQCPVNTVLTASFFMSGTNYCKVPGSHEITPEKVSLTPDTARQETYVFQFTSDTSSTTGKVLSWVVIYDRLGNQLAMTNSVQNKLSTTQSPSFFHRWDLLINVLNSYWGGILTTSFGIAFH